jgi:hypothetical protein
MVGRAETRPSGDSRERAEASETRQVGRAETLVPSARRHPGRGLGVTPLPRAVGTLERGDRPMPPADLAAYLDDLDRLNRWFGGYGLSARAIDGLVGDGAASRRVLVADVGGARGDFARWLVRRACRRRRDLAVVVVDRDHSALAAGRSGAGADPRADPRLLWVQADATALPLRDGGIDVAATSLTLHHVEPPGAVRMLRALRRAARQGVVVNDLLRSRLSYALVALAVRLFSRHPFSREDGPLSVLRAYAPAEVGSLARLAGFMRLRVRRYPPFARLTAVGS